MSAKSKEFRLRRRLVGADVAVNRGIVPFSLMRSGHKHYGVEVSRRALSDAFAPEVARYESLSIFVRRHFLRLERASCHVSFPQTPFPWRKKL